MMMKRLVLKVLEGSFAFGDDCSLLLQDNLMHEHCGDFHSWDLSESC